MKKYSINVAVKAALVAAIYTILTIMPPFSAISYGMIQFRVSEVLMFTALFSPAYAVGLFIGCLLANLYGAGNMFDIVLGSLTTLLAGLTLYKGRRLFLKHKWLAPLPVAVYNAIVVGSYLPFVLLNISVSQLFSGDFSSLWQKAMAATPILWSVLSVLVGELVVCYVGGIPMIWLCERYKKHLVK